MQALTATAGSTVAGRAAARVVAAAVPQTCARIQERSRTRKPRLAADRGRRRRRRRLRLCDVRPGKGGDAGSDGGDGETCVGGQAPAKARAGTQTAGGAGGDPDGQSGCLGRAGRGAGRSGSMNSAAAVAAAACRRWRAGATQTAAFD